MPHDVHQYLLEYGYLALFLLLFLQEVGVPSPFPNELLLIFAGVVSYSGILSFSGIVATAFAADLLSSSLLYFVFFKFGKAIFVKKPFWLPISYVKIEALSDRVARNGLFVVFIGRITPFIRGYVSVMAGLIRIKSREYIPIQIATAFIWALGYILIGYLMAFYGFSLKGHLRTIETVCWQMSLVIIAVVTVCIAMKLRFANRKQE